MIGRVLGSLGLVALLVGCGLSPESHPRVLDAGDAPRGVDTTPVPAASGSSRILVYWSRNNVLVAVSRAVTAQPDPSLALQALVAGPTRREQDAGLVSAVSPRLFAAEVAQGSGGVVIVENPAPDASSSGRTDEVFAYAQVVLTLTSLTDVNGVRFVRDGQPLAVPRSDGTLSLGPLTRRDYGDLL